MSAFQPWLLNPDPDWPGTLAKPEGDGWIWASDEVDVLRRFGQGETLEIVAAASKVENLSAVRVILADYRVQTWQCRFTRGSILGWSSPGSGHCLALGRRGGAWVRRATLPESFR